MIWASLLLLILVILVPASYKTRNSVVTNFNQGVSVFEDFLETTNPGIYFESLTAGSGDVIPGGALTPFSGANYSGYVSLDVGLPSEVACVYSKTFSTVGSSVLAAETRLCFDTLMSATEVSEMYFGYCVSPGSPLGGSVAALITYDKSISDNFRIYLKNGTTTSQITSVTVTPNTDYYLKVLINTSSVLYFINNIFVGSFPLPAAITNGNVALCLTKTAAVSGAHQIVYCDAIGMYQQFTTPRIFSNTVVTQ